MHILPRAPLESKASRLASSRRKLYSVSPMGKESRPGDEILMSTLNSKLLSDENRPALISACETLIEEEVASKSGLTGLAIKTAFKTVRKLRAGMIRELVDVLLDDFVNSLEGVYTDYLGEGGGNIVAYVEAKSDGVADALLSITDARAQRSTNSVLVKAYKTLRPQGKKQVIKAMPRIGAMLQRQGI